jgi:hypothetical protein
MLRRWPSGGSPGPISFEAPVVGPMTTLVARLHPPIHEERARYTGLYSVEYDGEIVVVGSRNPECALARILLAKGITGKVTMLDAARLNRCHCFASSAEFERRLRSLCHSGVQYGYSQ